MKTNGKKAHMLFSGNDNVGDDIDNTVISENKNELLGIIFDSKLSFKYHINNLCKNVSQTLNALVRVVPYMCLKKRNAVLKFVISRFGYCPLVWVFHSRDLNNKIIQFNNSFHLHFRSC